MPSCSNRGSVWISAIQKWRWWTSVWTSSGTGCGRRRRPCSRKRTSLSVRGWPGPGEGTVTVPVRPVLADFRNTAGCILGRETGPVAPWKRVRFSCTFNIIPSVALLFILILVMKCGWDFTRGCFCRGTFLVHSMARFWKCWILAVKNDHGVTGFSELDLAWLAALKALCFLRTRSHLMDTCPSRGRRGRVAWRRSVPTSSRRLCPGSRLGLNFWWSQPCPTGPGPCRLPRGPWKSRRCPTWDLGPLRKQKVKPGTC